MGSQITGLGLALLDDSLCSSIGGSVTWRLPGLLLGVSDGCLTGELIISPRLQLVLATVPLLAELPAWGGVLLTLLFVLLSMVTPVMELCSLSKIVLCPNANPSPTMLV